MSNSGLIIPNAGETQSAIDKRLFAEAVADKVLSYPSGSPERWKAIFMAWYNIDPQAKQDHADACQVAQEIAATLEDKDYGLTRASRGVAFGEEVNGHIRSSLVAVLPETFKGWLVKYDPYLNANYNKGAKEQRKAWRRLYATFPCYRTTQKLGAH